MCFKYPAPINEMNINVLKTFKKISQMPSWSVRSFNWKRAALAAVSLGATVIEKHFTINKNYQVLIIKRLCLQRIRRLC